MHVCLQVSSTAVFGSIVSGGKTYQMLMAYEIGVTWENAYQSSYATCISDLTSAGALALSSSNFEYENLYQYPSLKLKEFSRAGIVIDSIMFYVMDITIPYVFLDPRTLGIESELLAAINTAVDVKFRTRMIEAACAPFKTLRPFQCTRQTTLARTPLEIISLAFSNSQLAASFLVVFAAILVSRGGRPSGEWEEDVASSVPNFLLRSNQVKDSAPN